MKSEFPEFLLLAQTRNLGFAEGCNQGIVASTGEWVATLNNDAVAEPEWAEELVRAAAAAPPACGMLQSLLLYQAKANTINSTGIELTGSGSGRDRDEGKPLGANRSPEEIFCPTAGAAAYRRSMLDAIQLPEGYFDPRYFMYYEDMDLGWRARLAGWSALYVPRSVVHHRWHGSADRHGRAWLVVTSRTNRIRTLLKNASPAFILRTSPQSIREILELARHGQLQGMRGLVRAVQESVRTRARITSMARRERSAVEREWRVKSR
jgi:hypothetical protein